MWCNSWLLVFHYKNRKISLVLNKIGNGKRVNKKSSQHLLRALVECGLSLSTLLDDCVAIMNAQPFLE